MKAKLLLYLLPMLALTACGGSKPNPDPGPDPQDKTETTTVTFLNNSSFPAGGVAEHDTAFVTAFNGDGDLLASVSATTQNGTQIANNLNASVSGVSSILQLGSQSSDAFITFSFNYAVTKIEVEAQAYWKAYYQNGTGPLSYNVDPKSNLYIGNDTNYMDLTAEGGEEPLKVIQSFNFDKSYSVKLYNKMSGTERARTFIHSMKITYIVLEE